MVIVEDHVIFFCSWNPEEDHMDPDMADARAEGMGKEATYEHSAALFVFNRPSEQSKATEAAKWNATQTPQASSAMKTLSFAFYFCIFL